MIAISRPQCAAVNGFAPSTPCVSDDRVARPSRWAVFFTAFLRALAVAAA